MTATNPPKLFDAVVGLNLDEIEVQCGKKYTGFEYYAIQKREPKKNRSVVNTSLDNYAITNMAYAAWKVMLENNPNSELTKQLWIAMDKTTQQNW